MRIAVLSALLFVAIPAGAQACGEGKFTLELYGALGSPKEELTYRIYSINKDQWSRSRTSAFGKRLEHNLYNGSMITSTQAYELMDTTSAKAKDELRRCLKHSRKKVSGTTEDCRLTFNTWEMYSVPYILELKSKKTHAYIVACLFGACNRTSFVLWNARPQIVRRE